jgi:hypothetical protein
LLWEASPSKVPEISSQLMARLGGWHLSYQLGKGSTDRRIVVQLSPGIKWDPISKNKQTTRTKITKRAQAWLCQSACLVSRRL